ncbi:LytR/AlgR family response regulator transcription factor [Costertonia aggregata]|uniref:Response regulator transcription factor n=1 Tax=Costertonia aggregata TaxID=343403 RepID=A0A7H9APL2_9FLAO|nr:LytTR family DNA-binding domain-containing protein [Costertonia aggregata]QLG45372.1 response regulator transcription factor [Costertonia aggregata]
MSVIKVLLVDDEFLALNLLENYVEQIPGLEIMDKVKCPLAAIDILNQGKTDLLFLDIQMPTLSGINLLKTLKNKPVTIFTTAYSEHAVEAFGLDAVDYLLKPFSFERFLQAVNKAKEQLKKYHLEVSHIGKNTVNANEGFLSIKADSKLIKVLHRDIMFVEGLKEYVRIITAEEGFVTLMSLKELEDILPQDKFMRCHKSYIVNVTKVKSVEGNLLHLGNRKVTVSRDKKSEIVQRIFG